MKEKVSQKNKDRGHAISYLKPTLKIYGSVEQMTKANKGGPDFDGADPAGTGHHKLSR
jgi:hypothetical protein